MRQLTAQEREALMADMRSFDEYDLMDIYHGSPKVIEQPVFGAGKVHNDYGRGFYCTEHVELAKEWACSADTDGYANRRTKQEQRPSSLGLCFARRRKREA